MITRSVRYRGINLVRIDDKCMLKVKKGDEDQHDCVRLVVHIHVHDEVSFERLVESRCCQQLNHP